MITERTVTAVRVHPDTRYWMHKNDPSWTDEPGVAQLLALANGAEIIVDRTVPVHIFRLVDNEGWTKDETRATRFVVYRPAPDAPPGFLPEDMNGRWDFRATAEPGMLRHHNNKGKALGRTTGRFEMRKTDGDLAEVVELGPS